METEAFDFVDAIRAMREPREVLAALQSRASALGFPSFVITGLPKPMEELAPLVMLNAWPTEWYERYVGRNYFAVDPVGQWSLRATRAFRWDEVPPGFAGTRAARDLMGEACEFGFREGYCVPLPSFGNGQSAVAFASPDAPDVSPRELAALEMMGLYAANTVRDLVASDGPGTSPRLTARQRECLSWIAAGKSAWDVSVILGLSESTVHGYLKDVRRRLGVNSMAQAVAEAVRLRELSP